MRSEIFVYLESGLYRLTKPLIFGPQDSGSNGFDVHWSAAPGGATPTIAGSRRIRGWVETNPTLDVWSARIPSHEQIPQLYVNGARAWQTSGALPVALTRTAYGYLASSDLMSRWRNRSSLELVYTGGEGQWAEPRCPIAWIQRRAIVMAQPCWDNATKRYPNHVTSGGDDTLGQPTAVVNAAELLNHPGEFYVDRPRHVIDYIPRPGENMISADVEAPVLQTLVQGNGTAVDPVQNLTFSGIEFTYATWLQPSSPEGLAEVQAGYTITGADGYQTEGLCTLPDTTCPYGAWTPEPAAISFSGDHSVSFSGDQFVHLGAAGLNLGDGSQYDFVTGCIFTDISGNGLELGGVDDPEADPPSQTLDNTVADNHIFAIGVEYHGSVGILVGYAADTTISHNQIDHVPYSGISLGWGGWLDKIGEPPVANYSENNVVSDNLIFDYLQVLGDGGGIYNVGVTGDAMSDGQQTVGNVILDPLSWGFGMKSDDGAGYITYENNVIFGGQYNWGGPEPNTIADDGSDLPELLADNYWQQGDVTLTATGVDQTGNTIISALNDVPVPIISSAGIEPEFKSVLHWSARGAAVPSAPGQATVLYAFGNSAYVTFRPAFDEGGSPVESYLIYACPLGRSSDPNRCQQGGFRSQIVGSVSGDDLRQQGYAIIHDLSPGLKYSFSITAVNDYGEGVPSIASRPVVVAATTPALPGQPTDLSLQAGSDDVRLMWYGPKSGGSRWRFSRRCHHAGCVRTAHRTGSWTPALFYRISCSDGDSIVAGGQSMIIVTNRAGRGLAVVGGLQSGQTYAFSVVAVNPSGEGAPTTSQVTLPGA